MKPIPGLCEGKEEVPHDRTGKVFITALHRESHLAHRKCLALVWKTAYSVSRAPEKGV